MHSAVLHFAAWGTGFWKSASLENICSGYDTLSNRFDYSYLAVHRQFNRQHVSIRYTIVETHLHVSFVTYL